MSDSENTSQADLLAAFRIGPSWARDVGKKQEMPVQGEEPERGGRRQGERGERREGERDGRGQRGNFGQGGDRGWGGGRGGERGREGRGRSGGGRGWRDDRRDDRPPPVQPPRGVRLEVMPSAEAVALIAREIQQVARVYSLFDIAAVLLADRSRYSLRFTVFDDAPPLWRCRKDDSLWLTKEEALAHFRGAPWSAEIYEQDEIEVAAPRGNFQAVARCGLSGEWLGPPNYHGYQTALRRVHRERFSHMPFERYVSSVRTERGEEALNAWLATMTKHTRWRPMGGGDDEWMTDRAEVERHFQRNLFGQAFEETRQAELPGNVAAGLLSPALLELLKLATAHARKHPAMIIPPVCQMLERCHVAVFKRQGRLFSGPARPHPLAGDLVLAERPAAILGWLRERGEAKLAQLWTELLPEGQSDPCERWLSDLLWLLNGGHVLLFSDDTLVLPQRREGAAASPLRVVAGSATAVPDKPPSAQGRKVPAGEGRRQPKERTATRRKRQRKLRASILVRRAVEQMSRRQLKKARGAARVWKHRLIMRLVRKASDEPEAEEA